MDDAATSTVVNDLLLPSDVTQPAMHFYEDMTEAWHLIYSHMLSVPVVRWMFDMISKPPFTSMEELASEEFAARQQRYRELLAVDKRVPVLAQMVLCRIVDSYLTYLTELLAEIFKERPEALRSSEQVRLDFLLQYDTMQDLRHALAGRKVEQLSYLGTDELMRYFADRLGLPLFGTSTQQSEAIRTIELRNVIVHSHGVVSSIFVRRVPDCPEQVGERIHVDLHMVREQLRQFIALVADLDDRAAHKYGLKHIQLPAEQQRIHLISIDELQERMHKHLKEI